MFQSRPAQNGHLTQFAQLGDETGDETNKTEAWTEEPRPPSALSSCTKANTHRSAAMDALGWTNPLPLEPASCVRHRFALHKPSVLRPPPNISTAMRVLQRNLHVLEITLEDIDQHAHPLLLVC